MPTLKSAALVLLASFLAVTMAGASTHTVSANLDSGPGSLRAAIASAATGDKINFTNTLSGATITLASALTVSASLT